MTVRLRCICVFFVSALLGLAVLSCMRDKGSYEAEIKEFCFVKRQGKDTTIRLSTDTVRPQGTEVQVQVVSGTDLAKIVPWFTLSPGAQADKEVGKEYDVSGGFDITVTSENGKVKRRYHFDVTVEDAIDWGGTRGTDSVFLSGDVYIENVRLAELPDIAPLQRGTRFYFEVPEGTDVKNLSLSFDMAKGATSEYAAGTAYDFTDPLYVRLTSEDKKTSIGYLVYVKVAGPPPSSEAQIWDFHFDETLTRPVMQGTFIYAAIESGVDITSLTPRFERSNGVTVDMETGKQYDFSKEVKITVRSQDGSAKSVYTVRVEVVKNSEANLIDFLIKEIPGGMPTHRDDRSIRYWVALKTLPSRLTPIFSVSRGATLYADGEKLVSGGATDGLLSAKTLRVVSEDGASQRVYDLEVAVGHQDRNTGNLLVTRFDFLTGSKSSVIYANTDKGMTFNEGRIVCVVPNGTNLKDLTPVFSLGAGKLYFKSASGGKGDEIVSGTTAVDFSSPVRVAVYGLLEGNNYTIEVYEEEPAVALGGLKNFSLEYNGGSVKGSIGNGKVYVLLPSGVDLTRLTPRYEVTEGYTCGLEQGLARDFSKPVTFTVTSKDGLVTRRYEVDTRQGKNTEADLWDFSIDGLPAPKVYGNTITYYGVSESVNVSSLVPRFTISRGATASVTPGVAQSFKEPVKIKVTSEDGSMQQTYTIVVEQKLNNEAELLSFRFLEASVEVTRKGTAIGFDVPTTGVDVRRMTPIFEVSAGASASIASGVAMDFSQPVRIVVTSQDESIRKTYTVSRVKAESNLKFDFEAWRVIGSGDLAFEHPVGPWASGNDGVKTAKKMLKRPERYPLRKTTDAHTGGYAVELTTELVNNTMMQKVRIAAGSLFLGTFNTSNIMADPLSGPQFGIPYGGALPSRLQGWYKYQPGSENLNNDGVSVGRADECDIYAILYTGDLITAKNVKDNPRIIATARLKDRGPRSGWTFFDEEFVYVREPAAGEKLKFSIIMTSSVEGDTYTGAVGSRLVVDDVEVVLR